MLSEHALCNSFLLVHCSYVIPPIFGGLQKYCHRPVASAENGCHGQLGENSEVELLLTGVEAVQ